MKKSFKNDDEKISYALGLNLAMQVSHYPVDLDEELFMDGFLTMLEGRTPEMGQEEFKAAFNVLQKRMEESKHEHGCHCDECDHECGGADNKKAGDAFRTENAGKPGVVVQPSGLQIRHLVEGTGTSPAATDKVRVHYTGKLVDGKVFDSSVTRGEPIDFPLNRVIPGWTEGLQLMKEGGKAELVIPPELGYGEQGAGNVIPPQATLVFEVELIKVL